MAVAAAMAAAFPSGYALSCPVAGEGSPPLPTTTFNRSPSSHLASFTTRFRLRPRRAVAVAAATIREVCGGRVPDHVLERAEEVGYVVPTEVQEQSLPVLLSGQDCILHAQTGSGKTLAYLLSVFSAIDFGRSSVQALVVVPTRELGIQVTKVARMLAAKACTVMALLDGGMLRRQKSWVKAEPPAIIVATVASLCQMVEKRAFSLQSMRVLVIDEVDFIFGSSKQVSSLRKILTSYSAASSRQTIFASASIPQHNRFVHDCIQHKWTKGDVVHVHVNPVQPMPLHLRHKYVICSKKERAHVLLSLLERDAPKSGIIFVAEQTINLAAICTPADYNTRPLDTIYSNFIDALPVVKYCSENNKRLIHFSTCEVYGKTIGSFLPKDHPLRKEPEFYVLKEDESPCIFGPIVKQRWSYACAKQLIERLIFAEGAENGLEFTIVRPFNWIGPRMDFIPGVDGPSEGVPRVLACFSNNLLRREPLKLVDGGQSQRTFVYIKDAIEAVHLVIENPARANGHIFNVGNPNNEVTVRELAQMMTEVYANVSGEPPLDEPMIDVSSNQFYGEGYDDSDKRIPDMTIINRQLGWSPKTPLKDLLETTLTYQHKTYKEAIKRQMSQASVSS